MTGLPFFGYLLVKKIAKEWSIWHTDRTHILSVCQVDHYLASIVKKIAKEWSIWHTDKTHILSVCQVDQIFTSIVKKDI